MQHFFATSERRLEPLAPPFERLLLLRRRAGGGCRRAGEAGGHIGIVEIVGDDMHYQAMTDTGKTVDSGSVHRVGKVEPTPNRTAQPVVPTTGNGKKLPPAGDRK